MSIFQFSLLALVSVLFWLVYLYLTDQSFLPSIFGDGKKEEEEEKKGGFGYTSSRKDGKLEIKVESDLKQAGQYQVLSNDGKTLCLKGFSISSGTNAIIPRETVYYTADFDSETVGVFDKTFNNGDYEVHWEIGKNLSCQ